MKRKLVQQGATTLMVSLPSAWIKRFNLQKGNEIDIIDDKNCLVIASSEKTVKKEITLSFKTTTESAIRIALINSYRAGYDTIKIKGTTKDQQEIIEEVLQNYLLGMEITSSENSVCIIESITEPDQNKFEVIFQKIFSGTSLMISETVERIKKNTLYGDYTSIMLNIHRYDNFCRRVMVKKNIHPEKAIFFWNFLSVLIHVPRELYHLNKHLDTLTVSLSMPEKTSVINTLLELEKLFSLLRHAYYEKKVETIESLHQQSNQLLSQVYMQMKKSKNGVILYYLGSAIRNLHLSTSPLVGLMLEI